MIRRSLSSRLKPVALVLMLVTGSPAVADAAVNTATLIAGSASPSCISWRVKGICYWLFCTPFGCTVKTSVKVEHFIPEAVISVYQDILITLWLWPGGLRQRYAGQVRSSSHPNPRFAVFRIEIIPVLLIAFSEYSTWTQ